MGNQITAPITIQRNAVSGPITTTGRDAYQLAVAAGFVGTRAQWLESLIGPQGLSAYEVAVNNGFVGDVTAWLASLVGEQGPQGEPGLVGPPGAEVVMLSEAAYMALSPAEQLDPTKIYALVDEL